MRPEAGEKNEKGRELTPGVPVLIAGEKIASRFSSLSGKPSLMRLFVTPILSPLIGVFFARHQRSWQAFAKVRLQYMLKQSHT